MDIQRAFIDWRDGLSERQQLAMGLFLVTCVTFGVVARQLVPDAMHLYDAWRVRSDGVKAVAAIVERRTETRDDHDTSRPLRTNEATHYHLHSRFEAPGTDGKTRAFDVKEEVFEPIYKGAEGKKTIAVVYPAGAPERAMVVGNEWFRLGTTVLLALVAFAPLLLAVFFRITAFFFRRGGRRSGLNGA